MQVKYLRLKSVDDSTMWTPLKRVSCDGRAMRSTGRTGIKERRLSHLAFLCMSVLLGRTKNTIINNAIDFHKCFPFSTRSG